MGGYNTSDRHNGRDRSVKVGHEIKTNATQHGIGSLVRGLLH